MKEREEMKRNPKFLFLALLAGVLAFGMASCGDDTPGDSCNNDGVCDVADGETEGNCPGDCGSACNDDGVCDAGESCLVCPNDACCTICNLPTMTGTDHDFVVNELFMPTTSQEAGENGVDIDNDGDIDNKLGQIIQLLVSNGLDGDLNETINENIADGDLLLAARLRESGNGDGIVAIQILQTEIFDSTPIFDGNDSVLVPTGTPQNLYLCGEWDGGPDLETSPANITLAFPLPEPIGTLEVTLSAAQIRTVTDPDNPHYGDSSVASTGMTNVMIGGGLSEDEIYGTGGLIEFLANFINDMVQEGGSTADTIGDLFDGNCVILDDVAGCEAVVAGEGECDDTAVPPVITSTELKCNALLHSALAPDVDSDGDGEDDLLSLGLRVASAVPVTLEFQP
jgi:hypothetical protein